MMRLVYLFYCSLLLIHLFACEDDNRLIGDSGGYFYNTSGFCISGIQVDCFCDDGSQGIQICRADTRTFGECQCPGYGGEGIAIDAASGPSGPSNDIPSDAGDERAHSPADGSDGNLNDTPQGGTGETGVVPPPQIAYASGIRIRELAIYQGPKIPLVISGQDVDTRNAPVVIGREAMLRVFVEPLGGWQTRTIRAELHLESKTSRVESQEVTQNISGASREEAMDTTINFRIPGEQIVADLRYAVSLLEMAGTTPVTSPDQDVRWPRQEETTFDLSARNAGPVFLMLVPYRYLADGSGRIPSTSDENLETYKGYITEHYPITQLELSVHEPVDYSGRITSNTGWEAWLDFHCAFRDSEQPDPKLVYYGLLNPADTFRQYGGGVAGVSYVPTPSSNIRCSVGLGFGDRLSATTMTHEVGHSFGLEHAPCGVDGGPFPYADAKMGTWAYVMTLETLLDPNIYYDMMSYCEPTFISDYNYQRLFQRIRYLNMQFMRIPSPDVTYHRVLMDREGNLSYRGTTTRQQLYAEEEPTRPVELFDEQGRSLGKQYAFWMPFSLEPAGVFLLPEQHVEVRAIQIDGTKQKVVLP
ncbi:MAG: hypothetical protein JXA30_18245 [Deltaproteobacteria bacterium]|nr:hypothetical protein [Deltaproteobacteria bacterium]